VPHHREIVSNEQIRDTEFSLQVHQQVDHLRLHRHVESRHRLIADDQLRVERQRSRDPEPLALPAGEFVGVLVDAFGPQPDPREQPLHAFASFIGGDAEIAQRLGDDLASLQTRIQRGIRILEDDLQVAPVLAHRLGREAGQFLALELHRSGGRLDQAHHRLGGRRLAAAGFTDQRQRFAARHPERHVVDRLDRRPRRRQPAARCEVVLGEVADLEQGRG
jgi:hypothetical protein